MSGRLFFVSVVLFGVSGLLWAGQHSPIVVIHEGTNTVPSTPYYKEIDVQPLDDASLTEAMDEAVLSLEKLKPTQSSSALEHHFPIQSGRLTLGMPRQKIVSGLVQPIFIIGLDRRSMQWFEENGKELRSLGAQGVVVEAATLPEFQAFAAFAASEGISVVMMPGDAIAQLHDIKTYPMFLRGEH